MQQHKTFSNVFSNVRNPSNYSENCRENMLVNESNTVGLVEPDNQRFMGHIHDEFTIELGNMGIYEYTHGTLGKSEKDLYGFETDTESINPDYPNTQFYQIEFIEKGVTWGDYESVDQLRSNATVAEKSGLLYIPHSEKDSAIIVAPTLPKKKYELEQIE